MISMARTTKGHLLAHLSDYFREERDHHPGTLYAGKCNQICGLINDLIKDSSKETVEIKEEHVNVGGMISSKIVSEIHQKKKIEEHKA